MLAAGLVLLACFGVAASTSSQAADADATPTVVLHISDIHINRWAADRRTEDLEAFSQQVLSLWKPDKIIITGDLADAKRPNGKAEQQKTEWRVRILRVNR